MRARVAIVGLGWVLFAGMALAGPRLVLPQRTAGAGVEVAPPMGAARMHDDFDRLLREVVRDGAPDWDALRATGRPRLDAYLAAMERVDARGLGATDRLAWALDVWEATFLRAACERPAGWAPADGAGAVFHEPLVRTWNGRLSLDAFEQAFIRPARDPRVHAALWRGTRSGPALQPHAWRGADLDGALASAMRAFVRDPRRNRFDAARRTMALSRTFERNAADFGGRANLAATAGYWAGLETTGWTVTFLDWDGRLAGAPPR